MSMNGDSYSINLLRKECSCRMWLLTGLPCCHAISCMKSQDIDVDQYVPDCFRKERYEACYSHIIYPVNGQSLWRRTEYTDLLPPPIKRQPGRPKKNRRKDADEKRDEQQLKRAKYGMKCSRCKAEGHNKSTCKLPPPPPEPGTQPPASQVPTSQPTSSHAPTTQVSATQASASQVSASQVSATQVSATQVPATLLLKCLLLNLLLAKCHLVLNLLLLKSMLLNLLLHLVLNLLLLKCILNLLLHLVLNLLLLKFMLLNLLLLKCLLLPKCHQVNQQHQPSRRKGHQERRKDHHQLSPKTLDFFEIVCLL
jgi:hypothetical protein